MIRKITLAFLLALVLVRPSAGQSPQTSGRDRLGSPESVAPGAQIFLSVFQSVRDYGLEVLPDSALWERAVNGFIRELNDPYAQAFTPAEFDEFQEGNTGNYAGIGVQITNLNEAITITAVFRGTPAEESGLEVGDLIIGVNDQSTEGWTTRDASDAIRGEIGTTVDLRIARQGLRAPLTPTIQRDSVHISAVVAGIVSPNIGYIGLDRVARGSAQEVDSALTRFSDARGVILDLRGNPGGFLDESLRIGDLFLEQGARLASAESRIPGQEGRSLDEAWNAQMPDRIPGKPVIVLVDRFSASASEIIAGALQDHDRALIIGERTFGKGVFQNVFRLTEKRHLRLTTGEWFTPLGRSLHRPRTMQGRPLDEDPDTFRVVTSKSGRSLVAGGGVFPDLAIANDTLTSLEREFLSVTAADGVNLALRIAEHAFSQAEKRTDEGAEPGVNAEDFEAFLVALSGEGVPQSFMDSPEIREYLEWRLATRIADRMGRTGRSMEIRAQRDPVLAEAIALLTEAGSPAELYAAADRRKEVLEARELPGGEH